MWFYFYQLKTTENMFHDYLQIKLKYPSGITAKYICAYFMQNTLCCILNVYTYLLSSEEILICNRRIMDTYLLFLRINIS